MGQCNNKALVTAADLNLHLFHFSLNCFLVEFLLAFFLYFHVILNERFHVQFNSILDPFMSWYMKCSIDDHSVLLILLCHYNYMRCFVYNLTVLLSLFLFYSLFMASVQKISFHSALPVVVEEKFTITKILRLI